MILSFSLTENFNKSSFKSLFMNEYLSFLTIRGTPGLGQNLDGNIFWPIGHMERQSRWSQEITRSPISQSTVNGTTPCLSFSLSSQRLVV